MSWFRRRTMKCTNFRNATSVAFAIGLALAILSGAVAANTEWLTFNGNYSANRLSRLSTQRGRADSSRPGTLRLVVAIGASNCSPM